MNPFKTDRPEGERGPAGGDERDGDDAGVAGSDGGGVPHPGPAGGPQQEVGQPADADRQPDGRLRARPRGPALPQGRTD